MKTLKTQAFVFLFMLFGLMSFSAYSVDVDYTVLTGAVSFAGVAAAILVIYALVAAVLVVRKGARLIVGALR